MRRYEVGVYEGHVKKTRQKGPVGYVVLDMLDPIADGKLGKVIAIFYWANTENVERAVAHTQAKAYAELLEIIR